jgi:hypothetical protein
MGGCGCSGSGMAAFRRWDSLTSATDTARSHLGPHAALRLNWSIRRRLPRYGSARSIASPSLRRRRFRWADSTAAAAMPCAPSKPDRQHDRQPSGIQDRATDLSGADR